MTKKRRDELREVLDLVRGLGGVYLSIAETVSLLDDSERLDAVREIVGEADPKGRGLPIVNQVRDAVWDKGEAG